MLHTHTHNKHRHKCTHTMYKHRHTHTYHVNISTLVYYFYCYSIWLLCRQHLWMMYSSQFSDLSPMSYHMSYRHTVCHLVTLYVILSYCFFFNFMVKYFHGLAFAQKYLNTNFMTRMRQKQQDILFEIIPCSLLYLGHDYR